MLAMLSMLSAAALATAGFGPPESEEEDPAPMKPNPVECTALTPPQRSAVQLQPSTLPGRGGAGESQRASLFVGASLVSRGIITIAGVPMVPVDGVTAARGAKIVYQRGGPAFEKVQGSRSILGFRAR